MRIIDLKRQPIISNKYRFYDTKGIEFPLPLIAYNFIDNIKNFNDYVCFIYSFINNTEYLNENDDDFMRTKFINYSNKYLKKNYEK